MNKDVLMGALALSPLFGLFALFFGAVFFRSRYNKAHPASGRTPAQRLRARLLGWTACGLILAVEAYVLLRTGRLEPYWTTTFFVGLGGFIIGEALGRRSAVRELEGKAEQSEPVIFF